MQEYYKRNAFSIPQPFHHFNMIKNQNQNLASHCHDRFHINLITCGDLKIVTEKETLIISQGCAYIMPPGVMHQLISENGYVQIGMDINDTNDKNELVKNLHNICNGNAVKIKMESIKLTDYISENSFANFSPVQRLKTISLMTTLLILIMENAKKNDEQNKFRIRFMEAAEKYADKGVTLDELCKEFNFSKTHLERLSKKEFGCSAIKYIEHIRFLHICSLLTNTSKKLSVIAKDCGFCDSSHLSVFFKKHCGKNPAKFRKDDI